MENTFIKEELKRIEEILSAPIEEDITYKIGKIRTEQEERLRIKLQNDILYSIIRELNDEGLKTRRNFHYDDTTDMTTKEYGLNMIIDELPEGNFRDGHLEHISESIVRHIKENYIENSSIILTNENLTGKRVEWRDGVELSFRVSVTGIEKKKEIIVDKKRPIEVEKKVEQWKNKIKTVKSKDMLKTISKIEKEFQDKLTQDDIDDIVDEIFNNY